MSESYFDRSQQVKRELERDASFLMRVRDALEGKAEKFSFGSMVNLYRFGKQLESGLFVALRAYRPDSHFGRGALAMQEWGMEVYCRNAEHLDERGVEVPRFCVGAVYKSKAGILLEDVTANDQFKLDHPEHQAECFVYEGEKVRTVFIDIDASFRYLSGLAESKYFARSAVLDLEKL